MKLAERVVNAAVVVTAVCTLVVTSVVVRREFFPPEAAASRPLRLDPAEWDSVRLGGMRLGPPDAALTVVEFVDFECPACAAFHRVMREFRARNPQDVALVLQHRPLDMHPNAERLALVVECAAQAGRLEAMHDSIFASQSARVGLGPTALARIAGISDTVDFGRCVGDSTRTRGVARARALAQRMNINATPTVIANGLRYRQLVDTTVLRRALDAVRKSR